MKAKTLFYYAIMALVVCLPLVSCDDSDDDEEKVVGKKFVSMESPYLICASRNPGGVGFDFEYKGEKGGANAMEALTVDDFEYDIKIRTIKGEKPDKTLGGAPYIKLFKTVEAVNYSSVDTKCKGVSAFNQLNASNIKEYILKSDGNDFDVSSVTKGTTGKPLMQPLMEEYAKLVVGQKWKKAANNDIADDEPIWIIKTREGRMVKLIVSDFPSNPAPTATGYVSILWDFVE